MSIQDWAAVGEIVGGVAIIISLVYVGLQIRQNTKALKLGTAHHTTENFSDWYLVTAENDQLADIFFRGLQDIQSLQPVEKFRFFALLHKFFRAYENAYYQFRNGALDDDAFEGLTQMMLMIKTTPGIITYWEERKGWYNKKFQLYINDEIMAADGEEFKLAGS